MKDLVHSSWIFRSLGFYRVSSAPIASVILDIYDFILGVNNKIGYSRSAMSRNRTCQANLPSQSRSAKASAWLRESAWLALT